MTFKRCLFVPFIKINSSPNIIINLYQIGKETNKHAPLNFLDEDQIKIDREVADSRTPGIFKRDTACFHCNELWLKVQWITMKTGRIQYENTCRTGVRNLPNISVCTNRLSPGEDSGKIILSCFCFLIFSPKYYDHRLKEKTYSF